MRRDPTVKIKRKKINGKNELGASVIAVALLSSVLAGCGGGSGNAGEQEATVTPPPVTSPPDDAPAAWSFQNISASAGLRHRWGINGQEGRGTEAEFFAGGVAVGDFDNDGLIDIFVDSGNLEPSKLYRNLGNNRFEDVAGAAGVKLENHRGSGPTFADVNGDGWLDLFVGGIEGDGNKLFINNGDGTFVDATRESGLIMEAPNTVSASFGDINGDGFLDLAVSHWGNDVKPNTETIWLGNGDGYFVDASETSGIASQLHSPGAGGIAGVKDYSFTPTFADFDNDGWPDLAMVGDYGTSKYFLNDGSGRFIDATGSQLGDEFGMGSAIADYDNDGYLDWFITSIYETNAFGTVKQGNRLNRNGGGYFDDVTYSARVEDGGWGWAACFADFNNDGHLDLFHTNGWDEDSLYASETVDYKNDVNRLFINNGAGVFSDEATERAVDDSRQGRGVSCFDADNDGDIDILVVENNIDGNALVLYENVGGNEAGNQLSVSLQALGGNTAAVGSRVFVTAGGVTQMRELQIGSNFTSQNPQILYFGLGDSETVDILRVRWPDGTEEQIGNFPANQCLRISPAGDEVPLAGDHCMVPAEEWQPVEGEDPSPDDSPAEPPLATPGVGVDAKDVAPSVARQWSEVLLEGVRNDFARPTVHARNLFHISAAMYDAWAELSDAGAQHYLLGQTLNQFSCALDAHNIPRSLPAQQTAVSYAAYRIIEHRFFRSPGKAHTMALADELMESLGLDPQFVAKDYRTYGAAALGNHVADCYIQYGLQDGANEQGSYANLFYDHINGIIEPEKPGNPNAIANSDWNSWQPISLSESIDQSGNLVSDTPPFLSPEWGNVLPFSLTDGDASIQTRAGDTYKVYFDPGKPPLLGTSTSDFYQWNFALVAAWSAHLDPADDVLIDISPRSIGNNPAFPAAATVAEYEQFYQFENGGDASRGYDVNPVTGEPYAPQMVKRADYARVLAEFWADGPDSETPPGHWFVLMNDIFDHPEFERRFQGEGELIGPLEWDVKAYFALGGTMHDAAISAWSIKGYYDYLRPVSAIRIMADLGQSSDDTLSNYHPDGIPLRPGFSEIVEAGDPLAGTSGEHLGKIKLKAWRGPDYISDPATDMAGVDWILAENWWPYQRPTFVSPPFAGYISGHSTYSRAAAEMLTLLTGSPYFPGGMSDYRAPANEFLVFEEGPESDVVLQWATYRDASDQCSLSRIWGGIHPPVDDIPGRIIGEQIGKRAFEKAAGYFGNVQ
ncbi:FG-GAP-like repeat-containing protein [Microbulbifer sp. YPW1]|uniref:FG-GAP-like repeat-containing protein n=1 Tax=Microbulbifer sp. YPW1 TaxID=2745199 RepID=UPI00210220DF|nr:FG-GAP-like repeat-containing protein [Microbulbifer sp. YPW1]